MEKSIIIAIIITVVLWVIFMATVIATPESVRYTKNKDCFRIQCISKNNRTYNWN